MTAISTTCSLAPEVLGILVRRHGQFAACEDAVQEALLAAALQWPADGVPESPRAWLVTVASRRLIDELRGDQARRGREEAIAEPELPRGQAETESALPGHDDTLDSGSAGPRRRSAPRRSSCRPTPRGTGGCARCCTCCI